MISPTTPEETPVLVNGQRGKLLLMWTDGLPMQMSWREAGKLSDAALMAKIGGFDRFSGLTETADYGR